jgi:hypothetical protein
MSEQTIAVTEGSGKNVSTVQCTIGGSTVQIERDLPGMGIITLPGTPQVNAASSTGLVSMTAVDVQGRFYIICKNTYNDNEASAKYRIVFYDSGDVLIGYSEIITISNLAISDGGSRYMGENCIYSNDFGAKSIKFYITQISASDNISISVGVT